MSAGSFAAELRLHPALGAFGYRLIEPFGFVAITRVRDPESDRVYLEGLMVPSDQRGVGQGTALLKFVLGMADRHQVVLHGHINAFGTGPKLGQRALRQWYKRHGFTVSRSGLIHRKPNEAISKQEADPSHQ